MHNEFAVLKLQSGLSEEELSNRLGYHPRHIQRWESGVKKPRASVILAMQRLVPVMETGSSEGEFTFIDLFAGIGGLRKAFDSVGGRCVFTSEWDKYAQQTYLANNRDNRQIEGDITAIAADDIPEHNVLIAGFPCQPFSIAGVSKKNALGRAHGFADEAQGTLFFDVARILKHHRPEAFLLENVKNLKSHDKGRTFAVIKNVLENELGYHVHEMVIDARHFLPQHRQRIVIVGFRDPVPFNWSDLKLPQKGIKLMRDILHPEDGTERPESHFTEGRTAAVSQKYTLTDKLWAYLQNYAAKHRAQGNGFGFGLVGPLDTCRTLSARYYKDGSEILINRGPGKNPRRLTPRECARLMGYGDDFKIPVSDTQAYKQFGNSVAVPVFSEVARIMKPHILSLVRKQVPVDLAG
ncbi:DNA (cytosine-5-)-methyltransferase [Phyllobacterium sp. TAF24]|uniref:DNA (cytosine-5-)-methyltransferase n=1 Tax=Phyllobacterium sp. TAF24 TaxID=3233068 RepID=UPI003F9C0769